MHYTTKTFTYLFCKTTLSEFWKQNMILYCCNISFFYGLFRLSCTTLVYQIGGRQDAGPPGCSIQSDFNHRRRHHQRHYRHHPSIHPSNPYNRSLEGVKYTTLLGLFEKRVKLKKIKLKTFSPQTQIFPWFCPDDSKWETEKAAFDIIVGDIIAEHDDFSIENPEGWLLYCEMYMNRWRI